VELYLHYPKKPSWRSIQLKNHRDKFSFFYFCYCVQIGCGTQLASYPMGTGDTLLGVNRPGHEADNHLQLLQKLRICGAIPPPGVVLCEGTGHVFVVWYLVKHKDKFTFLP
jgi:hypothetical protein